MLFKKTRWLSLFFFAVIALIFLAKALILLDPDFGWRLRAGEYIIKNGIPKTDIFSYTMPSFQWVDHAWSQSALFYIIFSVFGYLGLGLVYTLCVLGSIYVAAKLIVKDYDDAKFFKKTGLMIRTGFSHPIFLEISPKLLGKLAYFPVLILASLFLTFFGVRVQVASWLAFSILVYILFEPKRLDKYKFFFPLLFWIWANLHGSFLSGLVSVGIYFVLKWYRERKVNRVELLAGVLSGLVTLVNPYGVGIWREVFSSILDSKLRWSIVEWMPALTMFDLGMMLMIGISCTLVWRYRKKFLLEEKGLFLAFLFEALSSRRHLPLWGIVAFVLLSRSVSYLWMESRKVKSGEKRFGQVYTVIWVVSAVIFLVQAFFSFREAFYVGELGSFYPKSAVKYLTDNLPKGEIFSVYGWGGYLIWKLPEKQVFVDGRMPSWRWNTQPDSELSAAFDSYNDIWQGKTDYKVIFDKYNIDTVLWQKSEGNSALGGFLQKIEGYLTIFGYKKNDFNFLQKLEEEGWEQVFEDNTSVIYTK